MLDSAVNSLTHVIAEVTRESGDGEAVVAYGRCVVHRPFEREGVITMGRLANISYDLVNQGPEGYDSAREILARLGLMRWTPDQKTHLPNTTACGMVAEGFGAQALLELIHQRFTQAGVRVSRLFVTIGEDLAALGPSAEAGATATTDTGIFSRFLAMSAKPQPSAQLAAQRELSRLLGHKS